MFNNLAFLEMLQKGGVTMIVLGGFSILSVGVMMERAWVFFRIGRTLGPFILQFQKAIKGGGVEGAIAICEGQDNPMASVFKAGLTKYQEGKDAMAEAMELAARGELLRLERYLGILGTIGSTAPFVGLFGTVLGIIRAFRDLAATEGAGPSVVADGIAEALVATAAGLFVAVPAVMAYNYFVRRVHRTAVEMEAKASWLMDTLFQRPPVSTPEG